MCGHHAVSTLAVPGLPPPYRDASEDAGTERLAAGAAYSDQGLVFADEVGDPLSPSVVASAFRRIVRETALPVITLHGLRHTWATLGPRGRYRRVVRGQGLGHSSPAITLSVYQHARPERTADAVEKVGKAIFG